MNTSIILLIVGIFLAVGVIVYLLTGNKKTTLSTKSVSNTQDMIIGDENVNVTIPVLISMDGNYTLKPQDDGNLVVYDKAGKYYWNSYFTNEGYFPRCDPVKSCIYTTLLQTDGNIATYSDKNNTSGTNVTWSAAVYPGTNFKKRSDSSAPYALKLYDNGQLGIYDSNNNVIWSTGDVPNSITPNPFPNPPNPKSKKNPPGSRCSQNDDCCSMNCRKDNKCCQPLTSICQDKTHCCSNLDCENNQCCGSIGFSCSSETECCSGFNCIGNVCCSGTTNLSECSEENDNCCPPLKCNGGFCQNPNCKSPLKNPYDLSCSTDNDCCVGTFCIDGYKGSGKICDYKLCKQDSDCPSPLHCRPSGIGPGIQTCGF